MGDLLVFSAQQKVKYVTLYHQTACVTPTQRNCCTAYAESLPARNSIPRLVQNLTNMEPQDVLKHREDMERCLTKKKTFPIILSDTQACLYEQLRNISLFHGAQFMTFSEADFTCLYTNYILYRT